MVFHKIIPITSLSTSVGLNFSAANESQAKIFSFAVDDKSWQDRQSVSIVLCHMSENEILMD